MLRSILGMVMAVAAACGLTAVFIVFGSHHSASGSGWDARDWRSVRVETADVVTRSRVESDTTSGSRGDEDLPDWAFEPDEADSSGARFIIAAVSTSENPERDLQQTAVAKLQSYATGVLELAPETASRISPRWATELMRAGRRFTQPSADSSGESRILHELVVPPEAVAQLQAWQTEHLRASHNRIVAGALVLTGAMSGLLFAVFRRIHRRSERNDER